MMAATRARAERKFLARFSYRVAMRRKSLSRQHMRSMTLRSRLRCLRRFPVSEAMHKVDQKCRSAHGFWLSACRMNAQPPDVSPPFPPLAERCAFTCVESMESPLGAASTSFKAVKIFFQSLCRLQRLKRLPERTNRPSVDVAERDTKQMSHGRRKVHDGDRPFELPRRDPGRPGEKYAVWGVVPASVSPIRASDLSYFRRPNGRDRRGAVPRRREDQEENRGIRLYRDRRVAEFAEPSARRSRG